MPTQDSVPKFRVGYSGFQQKNCSVGDSCVFWKVAKLGPRPCFEADGSWRHWSCISPKMLDNMKKRISGPGVLNGFHDLRLDDVKRIADDMGWKIDNDPIPPQSVPNTQGSPRGFTFADLLRSPPMNESEVSSIEPSGVWRPSASKLKEISARKPSTSKGQGASPDTIYHDRPGGAAFEPLVFLPGEPLPSLDFRPRTWNTSQITESKPSGTLKSISKYRENPLSIIGENFLFVDANERWEVSEITFGRRQRGMVTVEYDERSHKIDFEVFMSMLKHGVLDVIQEKGA